MLCELGDVSQPLYTSISSFFFFGVKESVVFIAGHQASSPGTDSLMAFKERFLETE